MRAYNIEGDVNAATRVIGMLMQQERVRLAYMRKILVVLHTLTDWKALSVNLPEKLEGDCACPH